ncbi:MAG: OsmC family protein [Calothrix sp. MO_167.B12]|nr:OsmC family protein [Calothrix sp. MO_167.B12]
MMSKLRTTYDGTQHCTTLQEKYGKTVASACSATGGKGEELSPTELVGAGLVSCMLFSMGTVAQRDNLDISDTQVDTEISMTDKPDKHIGAIDLTFTMPRKFSEADRVKLERASGMCPIKHSFGPDTQISVHFNYPE